MNSNNQSPNKDGTNEMIGLAVLAIPVLLLLPLVVIAFFPALLFRAIFSEERGRFKVMYAVFIVGCLYVFILGIGKDVYQGQLFSIFSEPLWGLIDQILSALPTKMGNYFYDLIDYPRHIRYYLYLSFPASLFMAIVFGQIEKKKKRERFKKQRDGLFNVFLTGIKGLTAVPSR